MHTLFSTYVSYLSQSTQDFIRKVYGQITPLGYFVHGPSETSSNENLKFLHDFLYILKHQISERFKKTLLNLAKRVRNFFTPFSCVWTILITLV